MGKSTTDIPVVYTRKFRNFGQKWTMLLFLLRATEPKRGIEGEEGVIQAVVGHLVDRYRNLSDFLN